MEGHEAGNAVRLYAIYRMLHRCPSLDTYRIDKSCLTLVPIIISHKGSIA